jgi:hypothetical protein
MMLSLGSAGVEAVDAMRELGEVGVMGFLMDIDLMGAAAPLDPKELMLIIHNK